METERFIRSENVKRYRELLEHVKDEGERRRIEKLLKDEERKQIEAGDFAGERLAG